MERGEVALSAEISSRRLLFEDLSAPTDFDLGKVQVTMEEIVSFAMQFDPQPFHLDPVAATRTRFGQLIASGWHSASLWNGLFVAGFLSQVVGEGSPGLSALKWPRPVLPGDVLYGTFHLAKLEESATRAEIGKAYGTGLLRNQGGENVLELELLVFLATRAAEVKPL